MAKRGAAVVAEVAIYGTTRVGHGFIARTADGRTFGNGDPVATRSATAALWLGMDEVAKAGVDRGLVSVHIDVNGAPLVATLRVTDRPWFGSLTWSAGTFVEIPAEAIHRAAEGR